jgi:hypothetical protein
VSSQAKQVMIRFIILIASICCVVTACRRDEDEFPDTPRIEFRSITQSETGIDIVIYFEDGNGDISKFELTPMISDSGIEYVIFNDTVREVLVLANEDTAMPGCYKYYYDYYINEIEPISVNGSIKGTITCNIDMGETNFILSIFPEYKRYFKIILHDRSGNKSNAVKTTEI